MKGHRNRQMSRGGGGALNQSRGGGGSIRLRGGGRGVLNQSRGGGLPPPPPSLTRTLICRFVPPGLEPLVRLVQPLSYMYM